MTDFFARLEARHRGEAGVLRPRVPFRFEPVSLSLAGTGLAGADLAGVRAAEPGRRRAHPDWPLAGPVRPGEPWAGAAVADGGQPAAGPEPAPAMAAGPRPVGLRPVRPAGPPRDQTADTDLSATGRADGAAAGGTWRAGQGPGRGETSAFAARQDAPPAPDRTAAPDRTVAPDRAAPHRAALDPAALDPAERGAPPRRQAAGRRAATWTADPGTGEPGAAEQITLRKWWSGSGGEPDEADLADPAAGRSQPRSQPVLRPEPPGDPRRQLPASASARGWPFDQRRARDHAADEPAGPGQESMTIRVTIGRVEVRAAPPAPRTAAVPRPSAGPTLADYLRHRSRPAGARS
jgi:hypothetical protein